MEGKRGGKVKEGDKNIYERSNLENLKLCACLRNVRLGKTSEGWEKISWQQQEGGR